MSTGSDPLRLRTVEVHAEGEPGRVVLDAAHLVQGDTMAERFAYCREHLHGLRELLRSTHTATRVSGPTPRRRRWRASRLARSLSWA